MNKEQKATVIEEVAAQIEQAEAVFAVDYRGITVAQVADLRVKLDDAGARFRVVKNTLTEIAAGRAGADSLKEVLEGPTAFTFVRGDGDVALAAKALAQFKREHDVLEFKGGLMSGEILSVDQLNALSRLPAREVLHAQLVGVVASPITGLVRGLNALLAGLVIQLQQIVEQGLLPAGEAPAEEAPAEEPAAEAEAPVEETAAEETSAEEEPAEEAPAEEQPEETDGAQPAEPAASAEPDGAQPAEPAASAETEAPSEGEDEKEG
jgi:large subunit ribosomal protein L10